MRILDGKTWAELELAEHIVKTRPNADHAAEMRDIEGPDHNYAQEVDWSMQHTDGVCSAIHKDEALIAGVSGDKIWTAHGPARIVWALASEGAVRHQLWYYETAMQMLDVANRSYAEGEEWVQIIPDTYPAGLRFALHLGFAKGQRVQTRTGMWCTEIIWRVRHG